jgi:hypothetical protein
VCSITALAAAIVSATSFSGTSKLVHHAPAAACSLSGGLWQMLRAAESGQLDNIRRGSLNGGVDCFAFLPLAHGEIGAGLQVGK